MFMYPKQKSNKLFKIKFLNVAFACCIALIFNSCASDTPTVYDRYDPLIWEARLALKNGSDSEALARFQEAFEVLPHDNTNDLFYAAEAALKVGKNDLAKTFIKTAFVHYNPDSVYYVSFFGPFKGEEIFDEIQAERPQMLEEYYANLSYEKEILDEIGEMLESTEEFISAEHKRKTDSINLARLAEITREYGWITNRASLLYMNYWHRDNMNDKVWREFKSAIDDQIKKGEIRKSFWAFTDDVRQMGKTKKQIYGQSSNWDKYPIMDIETVDKRRAKIGLPPIWYVSRLLDKEYPEGYTAANDDFLKSLQ